MDIPTIATAAWTVIAPLLPMIASKGAEKLGEEAGASLWTAVKEKFEKKPAAQESLEDMLKAPKDEDFQAAFRVQLKKALQEDDGFAKQLASLVEKAEASYNATLKGDGAIAQGNNATAVGKGGINIGGGVSGSTIVTGDGNKIGK
jgi:predicted negative regulator of RcsB-dependent stress response